MEIVQAQIVWQSEAVVKGGQVKVFLDTGTRGSMNRDGAPRGILTAPNGSVKQRGRCLTNQRVTVKTLQVGRQSAPPGGVLVPC